MSLFKYVQFSSICPSLRSSILKTWRMSVQLVCKSWNSLMPTFIWWLCEFFNVSSFQNGSHPCESNFGSSREIEIAIVKHRWNSLILKQYENVWIKCFTCINFILSLKEMQHTIKKVNLIVQTLLERTKMMENNWF